MNKNINKEVKKLRPFTRFIYTIGELPSSYLFSMTYEEQLIWLCNYLAQTVIPTVNNNGEAVEELQNLYIELKEYVDNYFENLDVQEEINNKLDEMVEQGTLQEIIGDYLNSKAVFGFDTVADMKSATNLIDGSYARTLGNTSYLDGKGAYYKVREIRNTDVVDEVHIISLDNSETLICELITDNLEVNGFLTYNTVSDLKNANNFVEGSIAKTLGFYSINDGGGATYKIRLATNEDTIDNSFIIELNNSNTLIAELIYESPINILKLGAKNDNSTDVSTIINNATQKGNIFIPKGQYKVSSQINLYNSISGENYVRYAKTNVNDSVLVSNITCSYADKETVSVLNIDHLNNGSNIKNIGIILKDYECAINGTGASGNYIYFDGISISNVKSTGIKLSHTSSRGLYLNNITIWGTDESFENSKGIDISANDYKASNIEIIGCRIGCEYNGYMEGSDYHIWCGSLIGGDGVVNHTDDESWFSGTKCLVLSQCGLNNLYLDTAFYKICGKNNNYNANSRMITNLKTYDDNSMPTFTSGTGATFYNWNGVVSNYANYMSPINYKNTMYYKCTYNNVRTILGVPYSSFIGGDVNQPSTRFYDVSYNIVKDITNTNGKIIEVAKIKVPKYRSGVINVYLYHAQVRVHKIQLYFYEGSYNGCTIDDAGSSDEKVYISTNKDANNVYTLYLEPKTKADEYITVNADKVGGFGEVQLIDLGWYDEGNYTFIPLVLDSTDTLTRLVNS